MKTEKQFPRTFKSSSAAYRAIRQYEEKTNSVLTSGLVMTKVEKGVFVVSSSVVLTSVEFNEKRPNVSYDGVSFRYYPDGVNGVGYYELKTGDRRRPNSKFVSTETIYTDLLGGRCTL